MRFATITALLTMLSACGNWSDEDLEYLYALPQKDTLKSKLTSGGNTTQMPLHTGVGVMSDSYQKAKDGSDGFNGFIDQVLGGLDAIRMIPPTRREGNGRWWGPYADVNNPGFDGMVEIHRVDDGSFTWSYKMRPRGGSFVTIAGGTFKPTESLRKGQGTFFFDAKTALALLMKPKAHPDDPDRADFAYATDGDPVIVSIDFQLADSKTAGFLFNGKSDKSAALAWTYGDPKNANFSKVSAAANWDSTTAGRVEYVILAGNWAGAMGIECWDAGHLVVYTKGYDENGFFEEGDMSKCIAKVELLLIP